MQDRIEVAAIVGSLRRQSMNRALMRTSMLLAPDTMRIVEVDIDRLPFYNEDVERDGDPASVAELKSQLARADAVMIFTPEYCYSIPGVLKNALDWASRPERRSVLKGKPVGIVGASVGRSGTMRAQLHLRQVLVQFGAIPMPSPEMYVTFGEGKFNALGELTDSSSLDSLRQMLSALDRWTRTVGNG
ncbi:MAG TPA: NADPH-dependent FMN reductase [Thermomicrobiales bacterium]|nr:NADPH-dependent FMN reductase [Thermomicrobiales bacterium]